MYSGVLLVSVVARRGGTRYKTGIKQGNVATCYMVDENAAMIRCAVPGIYDRGRQRCPGSLAWPGRKIQRVSGEASRARSRR